jgi:hypothetical protein
MNGGAIQLFGEKSCKQVRIIVKPNWEGEISKYEFPHNKKSNICIGNGGMCKDFAFLTALCVLK